MKKALFHERGNKLLHFFDRYLGIPIVIILGIITDKKIKLPEHIETIGILQLACIGDTILLSGLMKSIKQKYPLTRIVLFASSTNVECCRLLSFVDEIIKINVKNPYNSIRTIRKNGPFDIWLDFGPWPRLNAIYSFFSKAKLIVGFKTKGQFRHYAYNKVIDHYGNAEKTHEFENYWNLARILSIEKMAPEIFVDSIKKKENTVVIHAVPGGLQAELKSWPDSNWVELINKITSCNYTVFLVGGLNDFASYIDILSKLKRPDLIEIRAGKDTLLETARLLKSASCVIAVDSGIMHLASALSCNLISLHGPTAPWRWGPLNQNAHPIYLQEPCSPCIDLGFENRFNNCNCMLKISVDIVFNLFKKTVGNIETTKDVH